MTISLFKLMMRPESIYEKTRSVANISSIVTSSDEAKRSLEFLTLKCTHITSIIDLLLTV